MENLDHESSQEITENHEMHSLWLTDRLLAQLRSSSKIGVPSMVLGLLLVISIASHSLYLLLLRWSQLEGDFYLLEGGNLYRLSQLLSTLVIIYLFVRGIIEGHKSWRLLRFSQTDDDALLEGTERLVKMFRWLTICGGIYFSVLVLRLVWRTMM